MRADQSKFTVEIGAGALTERNLTPHGAEVTVLAGEKTYKNPGRTIYNRYELDGHTGLIAESPDSPDVPPIRVLIDRNKTAASGRDPAKVLGHEIGGHTNDILNEAESNPAQLIDEYDADDETSSEDAEKKLKNLPGSPSSDAINAVQKLLEKKEAQ